MSAAPRGRKPRPTWVVDYYRGSAHDRGRLVWKCSHQHDTRQEAEECSRAWVAENWPTRAASVNQ